MEKETEDSFSRLNVIVPARISSERTRELLGADAEAWLDECIAEKDDGSREFGTSLSLRVSDRVPRVRFDKAAIVELGNIKHRGDIYRVSISWRSSGLAPLFPVFAGTLTIDGQSLHLRGCYAPPGGSVGRLADRAILYLAAQKTAATLLEKLRDKS